MQAVPEVASELGGTKPACEALGVSRATYYRQRQPKLGPRRRQRPPRALSEHERKQVLDTLNSGRFVDQAPAEVHAALLDEGQYYCSVRTMYRILEENAQVRERRDQLRHPAYTKPELVATGPNQVWSWDITKLLGPKKWSYFYLYVILDIFSRYVVGWLLARRESATLAMKLIEETCRKEGIEPGQLGLHADRGPSMRQAAPRKIDLRKRLRRVACALLNVQSGAKENRPAKTAEACRLRAAEHAERCRRAVGKVEPSTGG